MEANYRTQKFTVEIDTDPKTGRIVGERWQNEDGLMDRPNDLPAYVEYCPESGIPTYQRWHRNGMRDREGDKPTTLVTRPATGIVVAESFWKLNQLHREGDQPAVIRRDEKGRVQEMEYFRFNQRHRDRGPAIERFSVSSGKLLQSEYWHNGIRQPAPGSPKVEPG